ncbi:hypothetical protein PBI_JEANIE_25 [Gordonia phage Jeanie]|uniref:Uncharacterized protein n=1 Tax=Gordonia phage McGonagall TaxID=1838072 RepID=A0A160DHI7_9CAUD|nr:hypothetical protein BH764_gp25 [Gordonia phage McGonagall]ANA87605.1 hypothetical protein MCGONAGALL_25 [Gordonia phage McGonagall]ANA87632.1 hypothetical protein PBI_JEANIE_25 [Gordonia phage Jeanie]
MRRPLDGLLSACTHVRKCTPDHTGPLVKADSGSNTATAGPGGTSQSRRAE